MAIALASCARDSRGHQTRQDARTPVEDAKPAIALHPPIGTREGFEAWVHSNKDKLLFGLPSFASATCGPLHVTSSDIAGNAIVLNAFYRAMLLADLGLVNAGGGISPDGSLGAHGAYVSPDVVIELSWINDTWERRLQPTARPSYREQLGPVETPALNGTVELVAEKKYPYERFWVGNRELQLPVAPSLVPRGTEYNEVTVEGKWDCTFTDSTGRTFPGYVGHSIDKIGAAHHPLEDPRIRILRATINNGEGAPDGNAVVTAIARVDVDAQRLIELARARLARRIAKDEPSIAGLLAPLRADREKRSKVKPQKALHVDQDRRPEKGKTYLLYSWDATKKQLTITAIYWRGELWTMTTVTPFDSRGYCAKNRPCPAPPKVTERKEQLDYGVELASVYTYDAAGKLVDERDLAVREIKSMYSYYN